MLLLGVQLLKRGLVMVLALLGFEVLGLLLDEMLGKIRHIFRDLHDVVEVFGSGTLNVRLRNLRTQYDSVSVPYPSSAATGCSRGESNEAHGARRPCSGRGWVGTTRSGTKPRQPQVCTIDEEGGKESWRQPQAGAATSGLPREAAQPLGSRIRKFSHAWPRDENRHSLLPQPAPPDWFGKSLSGWLARRPGV